MKPVFKEEMEYLKIPKHFEDKLWVYARAYYVFDKDLNKVCIGKNIKKFPYVIDKYLTHLEMAELWYKNNTSNKVLYAKEQLSQHLTSNVYSQKIINISGGKDSTVLHHMVEDMVNDYVGETTTAFFNTSNETHFTYGYIKRNYPHALTINPKEGFYSFLDRKGTVPSRLIRLCCSTYKEGSATENFDVHKPIIHLVGIRKAESLKRSTYTREMKGSWNSLYAQQNWVMYCPMIDFEDEDIWAYLLYHKLPFNFLYRVGFGRIGCTHCSYRSVYEDELTSHFLSTYYIRWQKFIEKLFIREGMAVILNCTKKEFLDNGWRGGVYRKEATKEVIQDFADYRGLSYSEAEKYFKSSKCNCCGKKTLSKDMIALNLKLLGRNTEARYCMKCLANYLETDVKTLEEQVKQFKDEGCNLF